MTKTIKNKTMFYLCSDIVKYTLKNYALPKKLTYDNINYYTLEHAYIVSYGVFHLRSDFTIPNFNWVDNTGDEVKEKISQTGYLDMAKRVYNFITKNGKVPTNVRTPNGLKMPIKLYIYGMATVIQYYNNHKKLPESCDFDYHVFIKPQPKPKTYSEEILDYFISRFGNVSCIDDALGKIKNKGYGYYYDDQYSNKQSIDRMRNGHGVNCTDSCHVFWHIGKALGYDVRAIHIKCRGGDGHIRLQFRKTGDFFNRDPAAVLDGECVECIWCSNGTYLATNPAWFLENLNR